MGRPAPLSAPPFSAQPLASGPPWSPRGLAAEGPGRETREHRPPLSAVLSVQTATPFIPYFKTDVRPDPACPPEGSLAHGAPPFKVTGPALPCSKRTPAECREGGRAAGSGRWLSVSRPRAPG